MRDIRSTIPTAPPTEACRMCGATASLRYTGHVSVSRGSPAAARGGRRRPRRYYHCNKCGQIQCALSDLPDPQDERERYDEHHNTLEDHRYREYLERFVAAAVAPYVPPGSRVLDFGSGPTPALTYLLAAAEYDPVPYDPFYAPDEDHILPGAALAESAPLTEGAAGPEGVAEAEVAALTEGAADPNGAAAPGGAAEARRTPPRFDAIVALEVVEHLHHPGAELERLLSRLRPGGVFAVRTGVYTGEEEFLAWWYRRDVTHVSFWTNATIEWIADWWGLSVKHREAGDIVVFEKRSQRNEVRF